MCHRRSTFSNCYLVCVCVCALLRYTCTHTHAYVNECELWRESALKATQLEFASKFVYVNGCIWRCVYVARLLVCVQRYLHMQICSLFSNSDNGTEAYTPYFCYICRIYRLLQHVARVSFATAYYQELQIKVKIKKKKKCCTCATLCWYYTVVAFDKWQNQQQTTQPHANTRANLLTMLATIHLRKLLLATTRFSNEVARCVRVSAVNRSLTHKQWLLLLLLAFILLFLSDYTNTQLAFQ